MQIDLKTLEDLAKLSRLSLTDEEKHRYAEQLSVIFEYFDMLREVDTDAVEETCQVTGLMDVTRDDVAILHSEEMRQKLIEAFPERQAALLKVKAVFQSTETD